MKKRTVCTHVKMLTVVRPSNKKEKHYFLNWLKLCCTLRTCRG